jgi:peptidoglycan/LPS O-acetylase OafA/YrhL
MISGFVICMSSWGRTPEQFLASRFTRLFPAYWVCVLITTGVVTLLPAVFRPLRPRAVLTNLTMLQDPLGVPRVDDVYWTLWTEMKFYALFTGVLWLGLTYRRTVWFCAGWAGLAVLAGELRQPWLDAIVMPGQAQYFIAGIALFLVHRFGGRPVLWLIVGLCWALSMHFYAGNGWQAALGQSYAPASMLVTLCFAVLILLATGRLDDLRWRGLATLGATSYPLYLLHYVVGLTAIHYLHPRLSLPPAVLLAVVLTALTVVAWLVHRLIERPIAPRLKTALRELDAPARQEQGSRCRPPDTRSSEPDAGVHRMTGVITSPEGARQ